MAFLDMVAELTGVLPGLSPLLAQKYINRAWHDVANKRAWSFLITDGVLVCPTAITAGAIQRVQYSSTVTLDADASAAIQDQINGAAAPGILSLQLRFGTVPPSGAIYSIVNFDNSTTTAVILTLDRVVQEATNSTAPYSIYRCYVTPPIPDFKTWLSLDDYANAIAITGDRLRLTSWDLDRRDPQRASSGLAYFLASWGSNRISDPVTGATTPSAITNASTPIYELWPQPTSGQVFYVRLRRAGEDLVQPTDVLPDQIDESLVVTRALGWYAYSFAQANVANFPTFKGANWPTLINNAKAQFAELLLDAKRNDNQQELQDVWSRGYGLRNSRPFGRFGDVSYPIDANFIQSHLIRF